MSDPALNIPIQPTDNSFQSHLQALDLLSYRLLTFNDRTRWPADIPLVRPGGKARVRGWVKDTNALKVNVGAGWWIEMTAQEAGEYIRRRKEALLLEHARLGESSRGGIATPGVKDGSDNDARLPLFPTISFNPLFPSPSPIAGPSRSTDQPIPASTSGKSVSYEEHISPPAGTALDPTQEPISSQFPALPVQSIVNNQSQPHATTLQDVVEVFLDKQQSLSRLSEQDRAKLKGSGLIGDANMINEEGLPIHEIREDITGAIIGSVPEPTTNGVEGDELVVQESAEEDYWSEAAKAKRADLMRRIFSEGASDSDLDSDNDGEETAPSGSPAPQPSTEGPAPAVSPSQLGSEIPRPASPARLQVESPRQPSTNPPAPRSILKPPIRKKSVSFDESVPLPPDSPPPNTRIIHGGVGFPLPSANVDHNAEFSPRPVPIIPEPKPLKNVNERDSGFAGFKKGFLTQTQIPKPTKLPAEHITERVKGQSLFAQRMAAVHEDGPQIEMIEDVHTPEAASVSSSPQGGSEGLETATIQSGLPKLSEAKPMTSMKSAVIERAPEPLVGKSQDAPNHTGPSGSSESAPRVLEIEDMEDDVDEEEEDEDEEDEYDLDDALLAREVALDYHRKLAYRSAALRNGGHGDDDDYGDYDDEDQANAGGVMLGLPSIAANGQIINPTPDNLRKYVRIGKLENGNFVLAPGEQNWSDEEDESVQSRREEVKRQLLGGGGGPLAPSQSGKAVQEVEAEKPKADVGLPPAVATNVVRESKGKQRQVKEIEEGQGDVQSEKAEKVEPQPAKRVSRFKAARMGL